MPNDNNVEYCSDLVNAFGEPVQESDVLAAYEQIDKNGEKRVRMKQFQRVCEELNLSDEDDLYKEIFDQIDMDGRGYFRLQDLRLFFEDPDLDCYEFCHKLLGGFIYDSGYSSWNREPALDDIKATINKMDAPWEDRVAAIQSLCRQLLKQKKKTRFCTTITQFAQHICTQLKDRRTVVSRAACICIAKICRKKKEWCSHVAPRFLRALFDTGVRGKVQIAADSAAQCCIAIVKNVPDNRKGDLNNAIHEGCRDKGYSNIRVCSFVLLSQLLHRAIVQKRQKASEWWTSVCDIIQLGIKDADREVRGNAYRCLLQLEHFRPRHGKPIVKKFKRVQLNTYDKIRKSLPLFKLTRAIDVQIYDIDPPEQIIRAKTFSGRESTQATHEFTRGHTYSNAHKNRSHSYDSSEEKEEDPEDYQIKKQISDLDRNNSSVISDDLSLISEQQIIKRLPTDTTQASLMLASSPLLSDLYESSKRDITTPKHIRQSTKELLKTELDQLREELKQSKRQIDSLQVKEETMQKNEQRIEILTMEFHKMMQVTETMDRKHVMMIEEMQRMHEKQIERIYQTAREESERRMQASIQAIVEAVSASPSIHHARSRLSTMNDEQSMGRSHSRERKYTSEVDMNTGGSFYNPDEFSHISASNGHSIGGGAMLPDSPAIEDIPAMIQTRSGRHGRVVMEAVDAAGKIGVVQYDDTSEDDSELRRRKSYRKIGNPKGGVKIDRTKQRDANMSFDFVGEAEGPLMAANSDFFDSIDQNPFAMNAPYRLTPKQRSFFYNPVE